MFKTSFYKIIELSKKIAFSLLNEKEPTDLFDSEFFSEEDKEYIHKNITDKDVISKRKELSDKITLQEDWKIVKSNINTPEKSMKYSWYSLTGAVAVIAGILFTCLPLFETKDIIVPVVNTSEAVKNNKLIKIGSNKATLTLEDGSNIELEKGKTFKNNSINNNGEKLIYKKTNQKEIKYNYLTIPRGGQYFVELSDGTEVWLNSESQLKFPVAFIEGKTREVELVYGEAYFDVSSSTNHNGANFKVINRGQEIDVLGTEFNLKAYKDETQIYTTLIEGKVTISNFTLNKQILLPNQQSILDIENNNIKITEVDIKTEISWKDGLFVFKEKNLKDIMIVISRWYDVDIVFANKSLENIKFKGVLGKDQDIEEILFSIKTLSVINDYKINDKTIILN